MFEGLLFLFETLCRSDKRALYYKRVYSNLVSLYKELRDIELDSNDYFIKEKLSEAISTKMMIVLTDAANGGDIIFNEKDGEIIIVYFLKDPLNGEYTAKEIFNILYDVAHYAVNSINIKVDLSFDENSTMANFIIGVPVMMATNITRRIFPDIEFSDVLKSRFKGLSTEECNDIVKISNRIFNSIPITDGYTVGRIIRSKEEA